MLYYLKIYLQMATLETLSYCLTQGPRCDPGSKQLILYRRIPDTVTINRTQPRLV
jgi:hypothetical protein